MRRQQDGECANTGVGVQQHVIRAQPQAAAHNLHRLGRLFHVHLEKRRGRDLEGLARHRIGIALLPGGNGYLRVEQPGLHQDVASLLPGPDGKLGGLPAFALELAQAIVDGPVHDHAAVDVHEAPGGPVDESQDASVSNGEPGVVAVVQLARGRNHGSDGRCR